MHLDVNSFICGLDTQRPIRRYNIPCLRKINKDSKDILSKLNTLRNRIWHRGTFILQYSSFDRFIGQYVLPIVTKVLNLQKYNGLERYWKYQPLICGIEPLEELAKVFDNKYDIWKVAFLKELGRSAYQNPLVGEGKIADYFNNEIKRRFEKIGQFESKEANINRITNCPVCGTRSLLVFDDTEAECNEEDFIEKVWLYTWQVQCLACSFEINSL